MPRRNRVSHHRPGRGLSSRSKAARNFARREHEREEQAEHGRRRPPPVPTVRCPSGKVGFSREDAARQLPEHQRTDATKNRTPPVRTYLCGKCESWHLTSKVWRGARPDDPPAPELGETG